ncbi:MAG TPA: DNA-binding protein WhiA, partial [Clostridiales bacterium]|nr:DNA-binding protein WhiA [Clostridiales bacterium]
KDSESVEDLLTLMGATESSLDLMGTKMYKDMRNRVNRRVNFENANAARAFDAAYKQLEAIRTIEEQKGLQYLPSDLQELALLRRENPDYSLQELGDHLKEPLSKSGVNHRLKKILELAEELRTKGGAP